MTSRAAKLSRRRFCGMVVTSTAALGCASPRLVPAPWPDLTHFDSCPKGGVLTILTWNIFMMPEWVRESPRNQARAAAIAAELLTYDFDILCLQKVFDNAARDVLVGALASRYPYRFGPANDSSSIKLNSGVWVLSRHPLVDYQEIEFGECSCWECFARKGALMVSGTCESIPFRLIATHLQGEEGDAFTVKNQAIRDRQMIEIRNRLIVPHLQPGTPFIICGDFGTPRLSDSYPAETASYRKMLDTLGVENGQGLRLTLVDDPRENQLATGSTGRKNELDYVFIRTNGARVDVERARYVLKRSGWDPQTNRSDLSYRYAVAAKLTFESAHPVVGTGGAAFSV